MNNKIIEYAENIQALAEKIIELAEEIKRDLRGEKDFHFDVISILEKRKEILNEKNNSKD